MVEHLVCEMLLHHPQELFDIGGETLPSIENMIDTMFIPPPILSAAVGAKLPTCPKTVGVTGGTYHRIYRI